ncbi:MAG: hypothetical protein K9N51_11300, partial [Candidatus Pacebacteria bacterium]|nr:hypothetical protein [Candidatus Paceibacterota bacterium]
CTGCIETEAIDFLVQHLQSGGLCIFCPTIPVIDLDGNPDPRLADLLDVRLTETIRPAGGRILDYGSRVVEFGVDDRVGIDGWLFAHDFPAGSDVLATHADHSLAAAVPTQKGKAIVVGFDPAYTSAGTQRFWMDTLNGALGLEPTVRCEGAWHHALRRRSDTTSFLTVINLNGTSDSSRLIVDAAIPDSEAVELDLELGAHEARCLIFNTRLGKHRLLYTTSELTPLNKARSVFRLRGHCGTSGVLAFAEPVTVDINGRSIASQAENGHHIVRYVHEKTPSVARLNTE